MVAEKYTYSVTSQLTSHRIVVSLTLTHERVDQGLTKRCRLSWLTNSALVYEPKCGGGIAGSQSMSTAVHMKPK
jgi:hypothetical protein